MACLSGDRLLRQLLFLSGPLSDSTYCKFIMCCRPTTGARPGHSQVGHPKKPAAKVFCTHCNAYVTPDILKQHQDRLVAPDVGLPSFPKPFKIRTIDDELTEGDGAPRNAASVDEELTEDGSDMDVNDDIDVDADAPSTSVPSIPAASLSHISPSPESPINLEDESPPVPDLDITPSSSPSH